MLSYISYAVGQFFTATGIMYSSTTCFMVGLSATKPAPPSEFLDGVVG